MLRTISVLVLVALVACESANAGRRRCRVGCYQPVYYRPVVQKVVKQVVQQQAVPQQVVNISNVYPSQANAYPRGNTQYSLASAAQVYALNPDLAVSAASRLADNAAANLRSSITAGLAGNSEIAQIAKLQAATEHLRAAVGTTTPQSMTLRITQGVNGIDVQEIKAGATGYSQVHATTNATVPQPPPVPNSVLSAKCSKCHGITLASPKGDLFLDAGFELESLSIVKALEQIRQDKMPPDNPLSGEEKAAVMAELLDLLKEE